MPVTVIDGQPVGTGAPGPLTLQLRDRYWASHEDPRYSTPVRQLCRSDSASVLQRVA
ncbi:MAG: hypothetical protein ABSB76_34915 [Streptosporangiaceae bacterium]|jgi:branched-chain amino acid aminotransferase